MEDVLQRTDVGTLDVHFVHQGNVNVADLAAFLNALSYAALTSEALGRATLELVDFEHGSLRLRFVARLKKVSTHVGRYEKPAGTLASVAVVATFFGQVALQLIPSREPPTPLAQATCRLVLGEGAERIEIAASGEKCVIVDRAAAGAILAQRKNHTETKRPVDEAALRRGKEVLRSLEAQRRASTATGPPAPLPGLPAAEQEREERERRARLDALGAKITEAQKRAGKSDAD